MLYCIIIMHRACVTIVLLPLFITTYYYHPSHLSIHPSQGMKVIFRVAISTMKIGQARLAGCSFEKLVVEVASKSVPRLLGGCSPDRLVKVRRNLI